MKKYFWYIGITKTVCNFLKILGKECEESKIGYSEILESYWIDKDLSIRKSYDYIYVLENENRIAECQIDSNRIVQTTLLTKDLKDSSVLFLAGFVRLELPGKFCWAWSKKDDLCIALSNYENDLLSNEFKFIKLPELLKKLRKL